MSTTLRQFAERLNTAIAAKPEAFRMTVAERARALDRADKTILNWYGVKPRPRVN